MGDDSWEDDDLDLKLNVPAAVAPSTSRFEDEEVIQVSALISIV